MRRRAALLVLACLSVLVGGAEPSSVSASATRPLDRHGFPRTYHVYGSWQGARVLGRYDMVVGYASNWDVRALRRVNRNGIFLLQPGLRPGNGDDYGEIFVTHSGGAMRWRGGTDPQLGRIRAVDWEWDLLREANGRLIGGWNLADPKRKGTPELVAKLFVYAAKLGGLQSAGGWDGVHSDNWNFTSIGADWLYGPRLDTDRDGRVDDYAVLRRNWADGLTRASNLIRSYVPGKVVGGNGNWWKSEQYERIASDPHGWLKSSNYTLVENFDQFYANPERALAVARRWLGYRDPHGQPRYIAAMQQALTCSGTPLQIPARADPNQDAYMLDPCVMRSMRWGLTLALMGGIYYEIYLRGHHGTRWWYDEFDGGIGVRRRGYLGRALGPARRMRPGVYRRTFANGVAFHNSSGAGVTLRLGAMYQRLRGTQNRALNNGRLVRTVTVPAKDGVVLLRPRRR